MSNTLYWEPSSDADIASYELQYAASATGPWSALATVAHNLQGADYSAGPPARFFYIHVGGTRSTWYRLRAVDSVPQYSPWSYPFQADPSGPSGSSTTTTALDIIQMALAEVGETTTVASLTSPVTKAEKLAVLFYERTRDLVLRRVAPRFATRRAALVLLEDHERDGWAYCYQLPTDLLRVLAVDLGYRGGHLAPAADPRWAIEADNLGTGRILCCDVEDAQLVYIARMEDPAAWDPSFTEAIVWALAAKLAMPLSVKPELAQKAVAMARQALEEASADTANESNPDPLPDSEFITGRSW